MTLKEFYEKIDGNYDFALSCVRKEERLASVLLRFAEDPIINNLKKALEEKDYENSFRSAHTLKGICSTLGFTKLTDAAVALTENLRGRTPSAETNQLAENVYAAYQIISNTLEEFKS